MYVEADDDDLTLEEKVEEKVTKEEDKEVVLLLRGIQAGLNEAKTDIKAIKSE